MGHVRGDDEHLHWPDGSHRWGAPPGIDEDIWAAMVRAHLDDHREARGGGQAREPDKPPPK